MYRRNNAAENMVDIKNGKTKKKILMYESYCCPPPTQMVRTPAATLAVVPSDGRKGQWCVTEKTASYIEAEFVAV